MASAEERGKRMIHTAGCIIIGDEVLGGKVSSDEKGNSKRMRPELSRHGVDCRYEFGILCEVLLQAGHEPETGGGHWRR